MFAFLIEKVVPARLRSGLARWVPHSGFQTLRKIADALYSSGKEIFLGRKAAFEADKNVVPLEDNKDLMSILRTFLFVIKCFLLTSLSVRETLNCDEKLRIPDEELIAHLK